MDRGSGFEGHILAYSSLSQDEKVLGRQTLQFRMMPVGLSIAPQIFTR